MITSVTDCFKEYKHLCQQAAFNDDVFASFRGTRTYRRVADHLDRPWGIDYIKMIDNMLNDLNEEPYEEYMSKFKFNDEIGETVVYDYKQHGIWSPTTLRYIYTALKIRCLFGSLDNCTIVEIGGGYGGQAAILMTEFNIKDYYIFDLNEVVGLISKYLRVHNFEQFTTYNQDQLATLKSLTSDFVISDFAFSEMTPPTQELYFQKVLAHSQRGYMTVNFFYDRYCIRPWPMDAYFNKFTSHNIDITSMALNNAANRDGRNCIITWDRS